MTVMFLVDDRASSAIRRSMLVNASPSVSETRDSSLRHATSTRGWPHASVCCLAWAYFLPPCSIPNPGRRLIPPRGGTTTRSEGPDVQPCVCSRPIRRMARRRRSARRRLLEGGAAATAAGARGDRHHGQAAEHPVHPELRGA